MASELTPTRMSQFRKAMESKIYTSQHKYGDFREWTSVDDYLAHFRDELNELCDAIDEHNKGYTECPKCHTSLKQKDMSEAMAKEAVDVANIAYMIWWQCTKPK